MSSERSYNVGLLNGSTSVFKKSREKPLKVFHQNRLSRKKEAPIDVLVEVPIPEVD